MKQQRVINMVVIVVACVVVGASVGVSIGCSNKMSFEQASTKTAATAQGDASNPGGTSGQTDSGTQDVKATCETATANGKLMELTQPLSFPDPGHTCDFGINGNLPRQDLVHTGRIQQTVAIDLPAGSTLCHVKFDFPKQAFRFDDHFWLTFNDVILAASIDYHDRFGVTNGLSLFDWNKIVGTSWDVSREGVYCLGGAACSWPQTDTEGTITMNFRTGTYYAVTARDRARNHHEFSFVTVGDNDNSDCQHRPVNMNATLQYVR